MTQNYERTRRVDGTFNFRDVGHYPARDGRSTRPGVLYRSAAIHRLASLAALGIRSVVDLRGAADVERDAGGLGAVGASDSVQRFELPLIPARVGRTSGHGHLNERFGPGISGERYVGYVEIGADNLRNVFRLFADPQNFPTLVHCTAGKDRTGVIVALALDVVGVPHDTIVADYALSNAAVPDLVAFFGGDPNAANALSESDMLRFGAPPEAMAHFLAHVHREHGSARALLTSLGVEDQVFDTLEEVLLTGP